MYRLTGINALTGHQVNNLRHDLLGWFVANEYEYDAASAIFSSTKILKSLDAIFPFWQQRRHSVFCSQLIAAELQSLGLMNRDNPARYNPGRLMRQLVRQGIYVRLTAFVDSSDPRLEML